jgi:hypothetical protein
MNTILDALLGSDSHPAEQPTQPQQPTRRTLTVNQRAVLRHLRINGPMTDEKLVDSYTPSMVGCVPVPIQAPSGLRTRRHELVELGYIVWDGSFQTTRFGRKTAVWRAS